MILKKRAGNYRKMGAEKRKDQVTFTFQCPKETACAVLLFDRKNKEEAVRIEVPDNYCVGSVRSITIYPIKSDRYYYAYEIDGEIVRDPYGERVIGREKWGDISRDIENEKLLSGFSKETFDWGEDVCLEIPTEDMVMYKLHVRGFSMDGKGRKKGTFEAIKDRLSYLKELGITTVEIMPVYEFEEFIEKDEEEKKLNYWGYAKSDYFAVKSSYAAGKDADIEFKSLVKKMHTLGMELIMEMHFNPKIGSSFMIEVLRYWIMEYHVDGFKLLGAALPIEEIVKDPYLSRTKLFYEQFSYDVSKEEIPRNLYVYNDNFLYSARKMLNHLGGDMKEFSERLKRKETDLPRVNYIANNNTFTLADIFSYNEKHNGENGEGNLDGNDWNYSTNYGVEGPSRRQFIKKIREKQMRNAIALLALSQGIPLIWSGDEIGNSQNGNNNAYCQDNKVGWVNWKSENKNPGYLEFVRAMFAFRKEHPILSMENTFRMTDYKRTGYPDLSYHGAEAWIGGINGASRSLGVMYSEVYAKDEDTDAKETFLYIGYNFYMGVQVFALPKLPKGMQWYQIMDTGETQPFFKEPKLLKKNSYEAFGQTISILIGR